MYLAPTNAKDMFYLGLREGLMEKLEEQVQKFQSTGKDLIIVDGLMDYFIKKYPLTKAVKHRHNFSGGDSARYAGNIQGKNISINKGVTNSQGKRLLN